MNIHVVVVFEFSIRFVKLLFGHFEASWGSTTLLSIFFRWESLLLYLKVFASSNIVIIGGFISIFVSQNAFYYDVQSNLSLCNRSKY